MILQYHGLRPVESCGSFDLSQVLDLYNPPILDESISVGSISSISTGSIPPFPPCHTSPLSPIVLETCSLMFPSAREEIHEGEQLTITLTIPTPPRIKKMLTEPLCVGKWVENLVRSRPPGHIPWGDVEYGRNGSWIPEGSIYPPDSFAKALSSARTPRRVKDVPSRPVMFISSPRPVRGRSASEHRNSFRKALVFEREITLNAGGETKRWSLQVPANTMNPEMVDMMLELQNLNSFFKDGLDDLNQSVELLDRQKERLEPPSLMVSDSHCAFPLSLESSGNLTQDTRISLVARRGKVPLPPISVSKNTQRTSYPSIPTAFLGSPSTYSPKFEFANISGGPTLDLEDMIANLRSQCIIIQPQPQLDVAPPHVNSSTPGFSDDETDDWAFSDSLLGAYDNYASPDDEPCSPQEPRQESEDVITWNSADITVSTSLEDAHVGLYSPEKISGISNVSATCSPAVLEPAIPSPLSSPHVPHNIANTPVTSPPREVRGILKSCKNVRFASLPGRQESADIGTLPLSPHTPSDSIVINSLQRPSRLRNVPLPKFCEVKENVPVFVPSRAAPSPVSKILDIPEAASPKFNPPPSTPETLQLKKTTVVNQAPRLLGRQRATSLQKPTPVALNRNSLKTHDGAPKVRRMSFTARPTTSSRWTMNEIPFRRGSNASQHVPDAPKSRMPVPLRNILTRFK